MLFAESETNIIHIPDPNNHVEYLMGIGGYKVKTNRNPSIDLRYLLDIPKTNIYYIPINDKNKRHT